MKKTSLSRISKTKVGTRRPLESWHGGGEIEIHLYARSLRNAATALARKLELDQNARTDWDACPVVLLYRQALEIYLKALVGEGSNFLPSPTDHLTLAKTHSLRWLAQIVCQIIRAVGFQDQFACDGVSSLAEFSALVNEVESFDPVARAIQSSRSGGPQSVSEFYRTFDATGFGRKMDALLNLLDTTADALAAEWDRREFEAAAGDFQGTIQ